MVEIAMTPDQDGNGNLIERLGLKEIVTELSEAIGTVTRAIYALCELYAKMGTRPHLHRAVPSIQDVETFNALEAAMPMQIIRLQCLWDEYDQETNWQGMREDLSPYFPRPAASLILAAFMDGRNTATLHRQRRPGDTQWFELANTTFVVAYALGFRMEATHSMGVWEREARRVEEEGKR